MRAGAAGGLPLPEAGHIPCSSAVFKRGRRALTSTLLVRSQPYPNLPCARPLYQSARCTRNVPFHHPPDCSQHTTQPVACSVSQPPA